MPSATLDLPTAQLPMPRRNSMEPVTIRDGAIVFHPALMEIGRYYWIDLNGKPYGYRRIADNEVEVYGLAE